MISRTKYDLENKIKINQIYKAIQAEQTIYKKKNQHPSTSAELDSNHQPLLKRKVNQLKHIVKSKGLQGPYNTLALFSSTFSATFIR
jgi:hypothetical protein